MGIGTALIDPPWQALLLFPFGLRMGILLQSPYRFWPGILLADLLLMALLADQFGYGPALWASVAVRSARPRSASARSTRACSCPAARARSATW